MKLKHITLGQAGLIANDSAELAAGIQKAVAAGYTVTDIEDDPSEPYHVATILYASIADLHALRLAVR